MPFIRVGAGVGVVGSSLGKRASVFAAHDVQLGEKEALKLKQDACFYVFFFQRSLLSRFEKKMMEHRNKVVVMGLAADKSPPLRSMLFVLLELDLYVYRTHTEL